MPNPRSTPWTSRRREGQGRGPERQAQLFAIGTRIVLPAAVAVGVVAASFSANAGDSLHPRTPVVWSDVACMEFVDRSVEPNYALVYGIPYEDTEVTSDEVEKSRTHQFFAICRQIYLQADLPRWITIADVKEAADNDEDFVTPSDDDIFERATEWSGCWHRINEDSARRPITDAMASSPVNWDTTMVPSGVYLLLGYTYEPPFNLWAPRSGGVVRVHDGGDPATGGPAAAITTGQQSLCVGEQVRVEGCINALPGSTMTAYFTTDPSPKPADSTWTAFAEEVPVEGEQFVLTWEAPPQAAGESTILRVDVTDPNGATYTAYQYETVLVRSAESPGCAEDPGECTGGFGGEPSCETTGTETDTGTSTGGAAGGEGRGCHLPGVPLGGWEMLSLLSLLAHRRRPSRG